MRWDGFGRSLLFALVAAAGYPAFALVTAPFFWPTVGLPLYLVGVAVLYLVGLGPRRVRGVTVAAIAAVLGVGVLALAWDVGDVAIGAALIVGVGRSALLYRARPARALVTEALLLAGGLTLARFLATPGITGIALAIWGFFLVQSVFFLVAGIRERRDAGAGVDPFELARSRALALLEET